MLKPTKFLLAGLALVAALASTPVWADYFPGEVVTPEVEATYCLHVGPISRLCSAAGEFKASGNATVTGTLTQTGAATLAGDLTVKGHIVSVRGGTPTVGTCGTSPSVNATATDNGGTITTGSTATTACTLTFGTVWTVAPICVFTDGNGSITPAAFSSGTATTSAVVVSYASATSTKINYVCVGK